nr:unnamed protein product [Spirometra erinaceieuropaei]
MYIPVPPKELHLAVNDTLLTNAADNCGHEEEAVDENTNEEEGCGQVTNWIEIDDPVRITCSSEPSLPEAQLEWLVNGEVPQFDTYRAVDLPVYQFPLRSVGDSCQCGHVCGGREQATDMTRQLNHGVVVRLRTYTVKICGMANNSEKLLSTTSELLLTVQSASLDQVDVCCRLRNMDDFLLKSPFRQIAHSENNDTQRTTCGLNSRFILLRVHTIRNVSIQFLDAGVLRENNSAKFRCAVKPEPTKEQSLEFQ